MKIYIADDYSSLSRRAANIISAQVITKPDSVLGLATGSSPIGTYKQLIDWYNKGDLDFAEVTSINLDEYVGLGKEDEQSYAYFMAKNLFDHINIKKDNINIPNGLADNIERECERYNYVIRGNHGIDLQLLGIGENGHVGFNEPGEAFEKETHEVMLTESTIQANSRLFKSIDEVPRKAISMGIKAIMQAKHILLIANGPKKADAIRETVYGPVTPQVPASILQLHNHVTIICDKEAGKYIKETDLGREI